MDPVTATMTGLTFATTRDDLAVALVADLAARSAARLPVLASRAATLKRDVVTTGGATTLAQALHSQWPARFRFRDEEAATLRGLWVLAENARN